MPALLVVQPGSLIWYVLPESVIDGLPEASLFPIGFLTAWLFWTLVVAVVNRSRAVRLETVPVLVIMLAVGCRRPSAVQDRPVAPQATPSPISSAWFEMGMPRAGLVHVMPESDDHGFYADYSGNDRAALLAEVSRGLEQAGYSRSCTALDGDVIGFSNGRRQLALKIDLLPNTYLSVFDEQGKEPLLHGLCYGRYHAGPAHVMTQAEKEAFAKQFEDEDGAVPTPSPGAPRARRDPR